MERQIASINEHPIGEVDRKFRLPLGRRPDDGVVRNQPFLHYTDARKLAHRSRILAEDGLLGGGSLSGSDLLGPKRSQAQQRQSMRMALANLTSPWALPCRSGHRLRMKQ